VVAHLKTAFFVSKIFYIFFGKISVGKTEFICGWGNSVLSFTGNENFVICAFIKE